jgi:hypothetical protein
MDARASRRRDDDRPLPRAAGAAAAGVLHRLGVDTWSTLRRFIDEVVPIVRLEPLA